MNLIKDIDILDRSRLAIQHLTKGKVRVKEEILDKKEPIDGFISINGNEMAFIIKSKTSIGIIENALKKLRKDAIDINKLIFLIDYASPELVSYFKEKEIFFIDTVGNCFVNLPQMLLLVEGKKKRNLIDDQQKRAFQKTGLKLLYHIFLDPNILNKPYRTIAKEVNVSLASIGYILDELKEDNFIVEIEKGRRNIYNVRQLIIKWANNYSENLRPKIHRGYFKYLKSGEEFRIETELFKQMEIFLGGEFAASYINGYLKPSRLTLYTNQRISKLVNELKIIPANDGSKEIEVLEIFWENEISNTVNYKSSIKNHEILVHPILMYSDLLLSTSYRGIEASEQLLTYDIRNRFKAYNFQW